MRLHKIFAFGVFSLVCQTCTANLVSSTSVSTHKQSAQQLPPHVPSEDSYISQYDLLSGEQPLLSKDQESLGTAAAEPGAGRVQHSSRLSRVSSNNRADGADYTGDNKKQERNPENPTAYSGSSMRSSNPAAQSASSSTYAARRSTLAPPEADHIASQTPSVGLSTPTAFDASLQDYTETSVSTAAISPQNGVKTIAYSRAHTEQYETFDDGLRVLQEKTLMPESLHSGPITSKLSQPKVDAVPSPANAHLTETATLERNTYAQPQRYGNSDEFVVIETPNNLMGSVGTQKDGPATQAPIVGMSGAGLTAQYDGSGTPLFEASSAASSPGNFWSFPLSSGCDEEAERNSVFALHRPAAKRKGVKRMASTLDATSIAPHRSPLPPTDLQFGAHHSSWFLAADRVRNAIHTTVALYAAKTTAFSLYLGAGVSRVLERYMFSLQKLPWLRRWSAKTELRSWEMVLWAIFTLSVALLIQSLMSLIVRVLSYPFRISGIKQQLAALNCSVSQLDVTLRKEVKRSTNNQEHVLKCLELLSSGSAARMGVSDELISQLVQRAVENATTQLHTELSERIEQLLRPALSTLDRLNANTLETRSCIDGLQSMFHFLATTVTRLTGDIVRSDSNISDQDVDDASVSPVSQNVAAGSHFAYENGPKECFSEHPHYVESPATRIRRTQQQQCRDAATTQLSSGYEDGTRKEEDFSGTVLQSESVTEVSGNLPSSNEPLQELSSNFLVYEQVTTTVVEEEKKNVYTPYTTGAFFPPPATSNAAEPALNEQHGEQTPVVQDACPPADSTLHVVEQSFLSVKAHHPNPDAQAMTTTVGANGPVSQASAVPSLPHLSTPASAAPTHSEAVPHYPALSPSGPERRYGCFPSSQVAQVSFSSSSNAFPSAAATAPYPGAASSTHGQHLNNKVHPPSPFFSSMKQPPHQMWPEDNSAQSMQQGTTEAWNSAYLAPLDNRENETHAMNGLQPPVSYRPAYPVSPSAPPSPQDPALHSAFLDHQQLTSNNEVPEPPYGFSGSQIQNPNNFQPLPFAMAPPPYFADPCTKQPHSSVATGVSSYGETAHRNQAEPSNGNGLPTEVTYSDPTYQTPPLYDQQYGNVFLNEPDGRATAPHIGETAHPPLYPSNHSSHQQPTSGTLHQPTSNIEPPLSNGQSIDPSLVNGHNLGSQAWANGSVSSAVHPPFTSGLEGSSVPSAPFTSDGGQPSLSSPDVRKPLGWAAAAQRKYHSQVNRRRPPPQPLKGIADPFAT